MARDLGSAFITIEPNDRGFTSKLVAQLKKSLTGVKGEVPVSLDQRALNAQVASVAAKLKALRGLASDLMLNANTKALDAKIAAEIAALAKLRTAASGLVLDAEDKRAVAKIAAMQLQIAKLRDAMQHMEAGVETRAAQTQIAALEAEIKVMQSQAKATEFGARTKALDAAIAAKTAEIAAMQKQANLEFGAKTAKLDAQIAAEEVKLAALTRERDVKIRADVQDGGLAKMAALLFGPGGGSGKGGGGGGGGGLIWGFGRFGGILTGTIGGVKLWKVALSASLETLIAVGTATAAAAVGIAAMAPAAKDVALQMKAIDTVNESLGNQIPSLSRDFDRLAHSMAPQVIEAYGGALNLVTGQTKGALGSTAHEVANLFDTWIAKLDIWNKSQNGFGKILQTGVGFLGQFASAVGNVLSAINNLMRANPGTAHVLLTIINGFAAAINWASKLPAPLLEVGLAMHAVSVWGGVAGGILSRLPGMFGKLGSAVSGLAKSPAFEFLAVVALLIARNWNSSTPKVQKSIDDINNALNNMSASQALTAIPAFLGKLNDELRSVSQGGTGAIMSQWRGLNDIWTRAGDKVKVLGSDLKGIVTGSLPHELKSFTSFFGDLFTSNAGQKEAAVALKQDIANIHAEINKMLGSTRNLDGELGSLMKQGHSVRQSLALMDLAGVKWNDSAAVMAQKVSNLVSGFEAMSVKGSLLDNAVNAITFATNLQNTKVSQLNSSWDTFIGTVTGGESGLVTFAQGINTLYGNTAKTTTTTASLTAAQDRLTGTQGRLSAAQDKLAALQKSGHATAAQLAAAHAQVATASGNVVTAQAHMTSVQGKLSAAQKAGTASSNGLNAASLQLQQNFQSSLTNANDYLDKLTVMAAAAGLGAKGTGMLQQATKDLIVQMLPAAEGSKTLTAELYALAQRGGYQGADSFQALSKWVGKTHDPMKNLQGVTQTFTVASAGLTKDVQNLSNALGTTLNQAMSQAAFLASGGQKNFTNFALAVKASGGNMAKVQPSANKLIGQLQSLTHNTNDTKAEFISFAEAGLGLSKKQADALWASYQAGESPSKTAAHKAEQLQKAFEVLAGRSGKSGLGLTKAQADNLWTDFGTKGAALLHALAERDIPKTQAAFEKWAGPGGKSGLGLTRSQADLLWADLKAKGTSTADGLSGKAEQMKKAFEVLAGKNGKSGFGLTKAQADLLWSDFGSKGAALIHALAEKDIPKTQAAFEKWAGPGGKSGLGLTRSQADLLWADLHGKGGPALDAAQKKAKETGDKFHDFGRSVVGASGNVGTDMPKKIKPALDWLGKIFGPQVQRLFVNDIPNWYDDSNNFLDHKFVHPWESHLDDARRWATGTLGPGLKNFFTGDIPNWYTDSNNFLGRNFVSPFRSQLSATWKWVSGTLGPDLKNFFTGDIPNWFRDSVSGIGKAWSRVEGVIKGPLHVIATPITDLFKAIDVVTNFVGLGKPLAGAVTFLNKLATGGPVPGGFGGGDIVPALLEPGEAVVDKWRTKKYASVLGQMGVPGFSYGGYVDPVGQIRNLVAERIDQGVDYQGSGPLLAMGAGQIIQTDGQGWPGGPFMSYKLVSGPLSGAAIYYAEHIRPTVHPGQMVPAGQPIATMLAGPPGIEIGFANAQGSAPLSQSAAAGGISGGNLPADSVTAVGQLFDSLLVSLGAPRAPNFGQKAAGRIPGGGVNGGGNQSLGSILGGLVKAVGSGIVGFVETIGQVFAPLGKFAKIGVDLATGNLAGAISAFLGDFKPSSGGAGGEFATTLLDIPKVLISDIVKHIAGTAKSFAAQQQAASGAPGVPGGVSSGTDLQNLLTIARYLMSQGASGAGAAGIAGTIAGESGGNPEAVGSGGFGLIGWTGNTIGLPRGYHGPTGNASRDLAIQMAGIIGYARSRGGWPDGFATASDPVAAGNLWSRYEAPARALSDTRPAVARQVFALLGGSGTVAKALRHGIAHAATGGRVVRGGVAGYAAGGTVGVPSLQMQHDADAMRYHKYAALYEKAVKVKDLVKEVRYSRLAARYARDIAKIDGEIRAAAAARRRAPAPKAKGRSSKAKVSEAAKLAGIKDPVLRLATDLADTGLLGVLGNQMEFHSLDPAPVGGLSHAQMAQFAMQVTPDVLNAVYGQDVAALAGALKGGITATATSPYAGVFGQSTAQSLSLLGALSGRSGVHGIYAGVRFAQGGPVNAYASGGVIREPVMGWGLRTGGAYSFAERGPETIVPGTAAGMNQTNFLLAQLIHETRRNTAAVQAQGTQTGRVINGTLTRAGSRGYYNG